MYGGGSEKGSTGVQEVLVTGRGRCGGDTDGRSGGGTDGGGGRYGRGRDRERISLWGDNLANLNLGTEPNAPLYYAPVLEHHHQIMSTLGEPRGRLEREIPF